LTNFAYPSDKTEALTMFSDPLYPFTGGKLKSILSRTRALFEESDAPPLRRAEPSPVP